MNGHDKLEKKNFVDETSTTANRVDGLTASKR